MSESKLDTAILGVQKQVGIIEKTKSGARGKYAPLDQIIKEVARSLQEHGLLVTQPICLEGERTGVKTILTHVESGETKSYFFPFDWQGVDPQKVGGVITYWRRYGFLAALGLTSSDEPDLDDEPAQRQVKPPVATSKPPQIETQTIGASVTMPADFQQRQKILRDAGMWPAKSPRMNELLKENEGDAQKAWSALWAECFPMPTA